jgi:hypothetical protein
LGDKPRLQKTIDFLRAEPDATDVLMLLEKRLSGASESRRYFALGFRNNTVRAVYPSDDDPLRYEQQIVADGRHIKMFGTTFDADALEWANLLLP